MIVYIDLLLILNFCYDFLIMLTIDITLRRNTKISRIIWSSLFGALSILLLFIKFNPYILFFLKIVVSFLMVIISFKYINIKYVLTNLLYMYMISIALAGFLYFLNSQFSLKQEGLIFVNKGISVNYIFLLIVSPIILYFYVKTHYKMKSAYNLYYPVKIIFRDKNVLLCHGFIDSGNKLKDPITKKYIIIVEKKLLEKYIHNKNPIYVPYKSLNQEGMLKCYSINKILFNNKGYKNFLVGLANDNFNMDGIECLLSYKLMEAL